MTFSAAEHLHDAQSPYISLAHILSHANHLQALRIRVAEPSGARTAWRKFGLARAGGIIFGRALDAVWPTSLPKNVLSNLRILEMDGFQDVEPLVRLAPHLRYLRMALSAGYSQAVNDEIVRTLRCVPELRHLSYTPDTLRLTNADDNNSSVGLLLAIGKSLPCLETLDLQTRYHRHSIYLCSSSQQLVQEVRKGLLFFIRDLNVTDEGITSRNSSLLYLKCLHSYRSLFHPQQCRAKISTLYAPHCPFQLQKMHSNNYQICARH